MGWVAFTAKASRGGILPLWSESKFMRFAHARLRPWFPCLPNRDGYNKRLRRSADMIAAARIARPGQDPHHRHRRAGRRRLVDAERIGDGLGAAWARARWWLCWLWRCA